jgi:hypothetical protein
MTIKLKKNKSLKIFVGPVEVAGYYYNLHNGLRKIGLDCDYVVYENHRFSYRDACRDKKIIKIIQKLNTDFSIRRKKSIFSWFFKAAAEAMCFVWLPIALIRYDIFIFGFGRTLVVGNLDLPILKLLGKKIISNMAHGSEARPPFIDGAQHFPLPELYAASVLLKRTRRTKRTVERHFRYATTVIGSPMSTSQFATKKFINSFALGIPLEPGIAARSRGADDKQDGTTQVVQILHCPSDPLAKGTELIVSIIKNLQKKGRKIKLNLITGRPFAEVLSELNKCDFVVDQVFSDTPMAGFAAEAALFRKPAVVGGYGFDTLRRHVDADMWPPSVTCIPSNLENAIDSLVNNPTERRRIGEDAFQFVSKKWSDLEVAKRYNKILFDTPPASWWVDPHQVEYVHGACQNVQVTRNRIRVMLQYFGPRSLGLSHRPQLEKCALTLQPDQQNPSS